MHQIETTPKFRHTSEEENQNLHAVKYMPTASATYRKKIEPQNKNHVDTHEESVTSCDLPYELVIKRIHRGETC